MVLDGKAIPHKGKARENKSWQAGWWDLQPLSERFYRPLEWSQSSIIFCAHPVQPLITARHFSSSKQFIISPPTHVVSVPTSYCPPSLISVAPSDDWLFAYFPGRNVEGVGVLWTRGPQIDNWTIKESWPIAHGAAPVAISWLGQAREWVSGTTSGSATRLPPRGPRPPVSDPTLLLVNQNQNITVCYFRQYVQSIRFLTCSTAQPTVTGEGQMCTADSTSTGIKQCFKAAIGLGYNEASILIAMRSHYVPPPTNNTYSAIDAGLPEGIKPLLPLEMRSMEWENWGEESTINLFEVQFLYNGERFGLSAEPLQPVLGCDKTLVGLNFLCVPPPLDAPNSPPSQRKTNGRPSFYLVSSYLDFDNYDSPPKSELISHSVTRLSTPGPLAQGRAWKIQRTASRSFTQSIVAYILPPPIRSRFGQQDNVLAGILDISGPIPPSHTNIRMAPTGSIRVLNLVDLTDHEDYEPSPIFCDVTRLGQDIPLNAVLSPNGVALATISSSLWPLRISVQSVPQKKTSLDASGHLLLPLASSLADSVVSDRVPTDISHLLSLSTSFDDTVETICQADKILDDCSSDFSHCSTLGILGTVIAIYRERAMAVKDSCEDLTARWQVAHELCYLIACNQAFDDCKDGDIFDLDAVWQLISLSTWIISLTEKLLKECVMSSNIDSNDSDKENGGDVSMSSSSRMLDAPVLLHICHPYFLDNFVMALSHVQRFCEYVKSLTPRGKTAQIARDITVDLISNSGVDVSALLVILEQTRQEVRSLEREGCRRALVSCRPTSDMHCLLSKLVRNVTQPSVLSKATLFIKPHDLVDGLGNLSTVPKDADKDIISKNLLVGVVASMKCSQCGGKTTLTDKLSSEDSIPLPWRAWEKKWAVRCICGGRWKNATTLL